MSNINYSETSPSAGDVPQAEVSTALPREVIEARRRGKVLAAMVLGAALASGMVAPFTDPYSRRRDNLRAESSTRAAEVDPVLLQEVKDLFEGGASEFFHDGMESHFSRKLLGLLRYRGQDALAAIAEYLSSDEGKPEVVSEALRQLGDFGGPETLPKRWSILSYGLKSHSPTVRDGAILGFASLGDPKALPLLLEAWNSEQVRELRQLIERVAAWLKRRP